MYYYYEHGDLLCHDYYGMDSLGRGKCYGRDGKDTVYFPYRIKPNFISVGNNFEYYIAHHIHYPKKAVKNRIQGRVMVEFEIDTDGNVQNVNAVNHADPILEMAAEEVIRLSPNWQPAFVNGVPVKFKVEIPVLFQLPD